jgi:hypothetical protein
MAKKQTTSLVPVERIERAILLVRGHKVMLDRDLAALYGVETKVLNQAVKRNLDRFPEDFMFQLTWEEAEIVGSQFVTLKPEGAGSSRSQAVTLKRGQKRRPPSVPKQGANACRTRASLRNS